MSAASAAPLPAPSRTLGAGLLLVVFVVAFEAMAVGTVLPRVAEELRGLSLYGWASSAFLLSSLFGAVLGGVLSDRRGLAAFALLGANSFLPLALHELRGLSLTAAGGVLSLGGATWTLGSWVQARAERRLGPGSRPLRVRVGLGMMTAGLLASALAVLGGLPWWAVYPAWVLACFGMGVGYNSNSLYALAAAHPAESGRLSGQLANIEVLCVAVAAGVGGALIARLPLEQAFALAFGVTLLAAGLGWLAAGRLRRAS